MLSRYAPHDSVKDNNAANKINSKTDAMRNATAGPSRLSFAEEMAQSVQVEHLRATTNPIFLNELDRDATPDLGQSYDNLF